MKDNTGENSKRNLFSQNDSEAQFIEQELLSDDEADDLDDEEEEEEENDLNSPNQHAISAAA